MGCSIQKEPDSEFIDAGGKSGADCTLITAQRSMNDEILKIAARIDRAADRLRFSGREQDAELCSAAALRVRSGSTLSQARQIETDLMSGTMSAVLVRLVALSGSGEYDTSGTADNPQVNVSDDVPHGGGDSSHPSSINLQVDTLDSSPSFPSTADTSESKQPPSTGTDFDVDSGGEPSTANVPYDPNNPPTPTIGPPTGNEGPFPGDFEGPEEKEKHTEPSDETVRRSEGETDAE